MKKFVDNLAGLLKVKTLVTLAVMCVFVILALRGTLTADSIMITVTAVVSFYFGTVSERNAGEGK